MNPRDGGSGLPSGVSSTVDVEVDVVAGAVEGGVAVVGVVAGDVCGLAPGGTGELLATICRAGGAVPLFWLFPNVGLEADAGAALVLALFTAA
jgi:hypothetical protein